MAVFLGSVLAVIGIALFAQWSILSNITSGVIIFFNYSVKIEVRIRIIENDHEIEGTISDIGLFFGTLKTSSTEYISIPNSVSLSKMIDTNRMNKRAYVLLLLGL
jgi:small-conductance mechanosensitive channel